MINQKNLAPVAENLKEKFKGWKQRSQEHLGGSGRLPTTALGAGVPKEVIEMAIGVEDSQKAEAAKEAARSQKAAASSQKEAKPKPKPKQTKYHLGGDDEDF